MRRAVLLAVATTLLLTSAPARAADGWSYAQDERGYPMLRYVDKGKTVFFLGCGRTLALNVKYPAAAQSEGKATVAIAGGGRRMTFAGEFTATEGEDDETNFIQFDLGHNRQDAATFGPKWNADKKRLLDLIGSKQRLTISADKASFTLAPNTLTTWRAPFDRCST